MKTPRLWRTPMFALAALAFGATIRADIEFVGYYATSRATHFILSDTESSRTGWIERGGSFAGWTVMSHDPKSDTLLLRRDGRAQTVRLKAASGKHAPLELTGEIKFGAGATTTVTRATLLLDQENVFPLEDGLTYRITPTRRPDGNLDYTIKVERHEKQGEVTRTVTQSTPRITTLAGQAFSIRVGDIEFSFSPKSP